jgi:DNA-binding transcriptional regulator YiaG
VTPVLAPYTPSDGPSAEARFALGHERRAVEDAARSAYLSRVVKAHRSQPVVTERSLTDEQVREIRRQVLAGVSQCEMARRLGVARGTVNKIVARKRYAEVE